MTSRVQRTDRQDRDTRRGGDERGRWRMNGMRKR